MISPSLWAQGDYRAIAVSLAVGGAVALLVIGAAYAHVRFRLRQGLLVLWLVAGLLLFEGLMSATFLAALPGLLAVVAGLAGSLSGPASRRAESS